MMLTIRHKRTGLTAGASVLPDVLLDAHALRWIWLDAIEWERKGFALIAS